MAKKYLYALLISLTILVAVVTKVVSVSNNICAYNAEAYQGLELTKLDRQLTDTGLIGRIHGAVGESQMFVLSVREPNNFFNHREFSLLSNNQETLNILKQVNRHSSVCLQGNFIDNPSPQKHIAVNSIKVLEAWPQPKDFTPYERQIALPTELKQQKNLLGKIHAIGEEGQVLVIEYQDGIIPIFVTATEYTQGLYRGDIVKLSYKIQEYPQQPTHLLLDTTAEKPIEIIDAIASWHNQPQTLVGNLVQFPQSPQLKFDVYGLEVDNKGIKRYFTLVNFSNMAEFENIRQKLAQIWSENITTAQTGRNMLINPEVKIQATGKINIISPEQANPQILLNSAEEIQQII